MASMRERASGAGQSVTHDVAKLGDDRLVENLPQYRSELRIPRGRGRRPSARLPRHELLGIDVVLHETEPPKAAVRTLPHFITPRRLLAGVPDFPRQAPPPLLPRSS